MENSESIYRLIEIFNEMIAIHIPILFIYKIVIVIKIELIHSEYDRKVLWLPLIFIGIAICHTNLSKRKDL